MKEFKKGDILRGEKDEFAEAYHPVVYISGSVEAPQAVVLTHASTEKIPCNIKLSSMYDTKPQYFVGHLVQKMSEWGPYQKEMELTKEDLELVQKTVSGMRSITWDEYLEYTKNGCPDHGKA